MANIDEQLKKIKTARYGEEVRSSIHDAINAMNSNLISSDAENNRIHEHTDAAINRLSNEIDAVVTGQPKPVSLAADMTDTDAVYLYTGSETGYLTGYVYIYNGSTWEAAGQYGSEFSAHVEDDVLIMTGSGESDSESGVIRKARINNAEYAFVASSENEAAEIVQSNIRKCFRAVTALRDLSMLTLQEGEHRAGTKYTGAVIKGLPYSSVFWNDSDILWNRNLSSFYSAMLNPASIVYQGSIWEILDGATVATKASSNYYGTMCSGLAGKAVGSDIYYSTTEMAKVPSRFETIDYPGADDLEIGTIMLMDGHAAVVYDIAKDDNGKTIMIGMAEEIKPNGRIAYFTVEEFEKYCRERSYTFGRYIGVTPKRLPDVQFATDVIPEFGDRTWYKLGDPVKLYVTNDSTVLYCKKADAVYTPVTLANLPSESINGVTVYNVTSLIDEATEYCFTTDAETNCPCMISVVNVGTVTINSATKEASVTGYSSNLRPLYYQVNYLMLEDSSHSRRTYAYPAPTGYVSRPDLGNKFMLNGESEFTFTKPFLHEPSAAGDDALYKGFSIIVHFENIFGMPSANAYVMEGLE